MIANEAVKGQFVFGINALNTSGRERHGRSDNPAPKLGEGFVFRWSRAQKNCRAEGGRKGVIRPGGIIGVL